MRTVILAISRTLVPGIEGTITGAMLRDIFRKSRDTVFLVDEMRPTIRAIMDNFSGPGCKMVSVLPNLRKYRVKKEAYIERAISMSEVANECFAFHSLDDWTNSSVLIAVTFFNMHPEFMLATYLVIDGEVIEVSIDRLKEASKFK
jgi:hypothetical protein